MARLLRILKSALLKTKDWARLVNDNLTVLDRIPIIRLARLKQYIQAPNAVGKEIENFVTLFPAETINLIDTPHDREFVKICRYYQEGSFDRSPIFTCEVTSAYLHIGTGAVFTKDFKAVVDSGMEFRLGWVRWQLGLKERLAMVKAKPLHTETQAAHIFTAFVENFWHLLYDCLPRVYSLALAYPNQPLTLLAPDSLPTPHRELIDAVLPENFKVIYLPQPSWFRIDRLVLASFVSRLENGYLPSSYYLYIKDNVIKKLNLDPVLEAKERLYISRCRAKHRRIKNEDKLISVLEKFDFKTVILEDLSLRDQIDLFRRAMIVVAPHGAGLATTIFSGQIKVLVLYPNSDPTSFFFTQIKGLGQEHYFITHNQIYKMYQGVSDDEASDFEVDLDKVENVLTQKMGLPNQDISPLLQ